MALIRQSVQWGTRTNPVMSMVPRSFGSLGARTDKVGFPCPEARQKEMKNKIIVSFPLKKSTDHSVERE